MLQMHQTMVSVPSLRGVFVLTAAVTRASMAHICSYLAVNASRLSDKTLTLCLGKAKTFRTVHSEVAALSQALRGALGVTPGSRIGLIAKGTDEFLQALLAVAACGAIAVPINLRWSVEEAAAALMGVAAELVFVDADLVHTYSPIFAERHCIVLLRGAESTRAAASSSTPRMHSRLHHGQDLIREHMGAPLDLQTSEDGGALICFTSGTSGPPKGVLTGHTALHCQAMAKLHALGYREDDVYLHSAPLFHIGGLSSMIAMLAVGATQVFQPVFNAAESLSLIRRYSVTCLIAVPAMVASLHEASQAEQMQPHQATEAISSSRDPAGPASEQRVSKARSVSSRSVSRLEVHSSVRVVLLGGGELPGRLKGPLQALFPSAHLFTAYGMTEACSSMTFGSLDMRHVTATAMHHSAAGVASDAEAKPAVHSEPHPIGAAEKNASERPARPRPKAEQSAGRHPARAGLEAEQSADRQLARPGLKAGRHEGWSDAGAIPVGWPPPGIEVAIAVIAADGSSSRRDISFTGTPAGEVLTRGPHVMLGYWGNPEATVAAHLPGGWLCTGDLGRVDARGCLWLLGRIKDTVRSGSENVNAAAVERVLLQVPGVAAAAVVGLPHDVLGEQVSALLSLTGEVAWSDEGEGGCAKPQQLSTDADARLSPASVKEACRQRGLSSFMVPRVVFAQRTPLPTNASGKLLKHAVREIMLARSHQANPSSRM